MIRKNQDLQQDLEKLVKEIDEISDNLGRYFDFVKKRESQLAKLLMELNPN